MEAILRINRSRRLPIAFMATCFLGTACLLLSSCTSSRSTSVVPAGTPVVRVLVLEKRSAVTLSATEAPNIRVGGGPPVGLTLSGGASTSITLGPGGWKVGDIPVGQGEMIVEPSADGSTTVDGHAYRGHYRFVPRPGGKFDVVNDVDVDSYLMGVIAKEMLPGWHAEAYRAQAIVARTYALYVARTGAADASYDLFADTRSQVYGGMAGETARSRDAVDATRGMVVAYGPAGQERIFKAYFSSCCGGVTQNATDAFGDDPVVPLAARNMGQTCAASPKFSWPAIEISKHELTRRMRIWGKANNAPEASIGDIARIDVLTSNPFGRPSSFGITDTRGYRYRLCSEDFRQSVNTDASGGPRLLSSFCKPISSGGAIRFTEGHGFGHGVGLCQYCAQAQASQGMLHEQIVRRAYPKAVVVKAY